MFEYFGWPVERLFENRKAVVGILLGGGGGGGWGGEEKKNLDLLLIFDCRKVGKV